MWHVTCHTVTWCVDLQDSTTALPALMTPSWSTSSTPETSSPSHSGQSPESASEAWRPRYLEKKLDFFDYILKKGSNHPNCYWLAAVSLIGRQSFSLFDALSQSKILFHFVCSIYRKLKSLWIKLWEWPIFLCDFLVYSFAPRQFQWSDFTYAWMFLCQFTNWRVLDK